LGVGFPEILGRFQELYWCKLTKSLEFQKRFFNEKRKCKTPAFNVKVQLYWSFLWFWKRNGKSNIGYGIIEYQESSGPVVLLKVSRKKERKRICMQNL